jgi:hypothetical protein
MVDYNKFKTPFYEISIGDSSGNRMTALPHHILRLAQKIEITEVFNIPDSDTFEHSFVSIVFVEGSREPSSSDSRFGTDGLLKIDKDIAGSITNRPGALSDLRFSGRSGGITFITEQELASNLLTNDLQINIVGEEVSRKHVNEPEQPRFLFTERNQVKVTWGYKEDLNNVRSVISRIAVIKTDYSNTGQTTTTLTCTDTVNFFNQLANKRGSGTAFAKAVVTTVSGIKTIDFQDQPTDALLNEICTKLGLKTIISQNLPAPTLNQGHVKVWIGGESFHEFLARLAKLHNCYYTITPNPKTGIDTLIFIKNTDFEARTINLDPRLFTYKSAGSIIKNLTVSAAFDIAGGNAQRGLDSNGVTQEAATDRTAFEVLFAPQKGAKIEGSMNFDPTSPVNPISSIATLDKTIATNGTVGKVENTPVNDTQNFQDRANTYSLGAGYGITIEMNTLGFTKLTPGVVEIRNIGIRFSGKYRLMKVTHTIDASGYNNNSVGVRSTVSDGGVKLGENPKGQEKINLVSEQLFDPINTTTSATPIRDKYDNFISGK